MTGTQVLWFLEVARLGQDMADVVRSVSRWHYEPGGLVADLGNTGGVILRWDQHTWRKVVKGGLWPQYVARN